MLHRDTHSCFGSQNEITSGTLLFFHPDFIPIDVYILFLYMSNLFYGFEYLLYKSLSYNIYTECYSVYKLDALLSGSVSTVSSDISASFGSVFPSSWAADST